MCSHVHRRAAVLRRLQVYYQRQGRLSQKVVAVIFLLVLASAYTTESIGIHALFGAFLMGAMMPKGTRFVRELSEKLEDYTVIFLLPIFFAYTGLQDTDRAAEHRRAVDGYAADHRWSRAWEVRRHRAGRLRPAAWVARGIGDRDADEHARADGTRDPEHRLAEGVITPAVFAMMVIMALVTTALTTPVLHWIFPHERLWCRRGRCQSPATSPPLLHPRTGIVSRERTGFGARRGSDPGRKARSYARRQTVCAASVASGRSRSIPSRA